MTFYQHIRNFLFIANMLIYFVVILITEKTSSNINWCISFLPMLLLAIPDIARLFMDSSNSKRKRYLSFACSFIVWTIFIWGCWMDWF